MRFVRISKAMLFPPGIVVATVGPDGVGKSTTLRRVETVLAGAFHPVKKQYMGWKQFMLPTKRLSRLLVRKQTPGDSFSRTNSAPGKNSLAGELIKNLSVLHYFLDLWARYLLRIRSDQARGGLVLCDRYFYDVLARDAWFSKNHFARSILVTLTPRPAATILFRGDPEVIAARKHEISSTEVAQQLADFSILERKVEKLVKLDAAGSLDDNVMDVLKFLFESADEETGE